MATKQKQIQEGQDASAILDNEVVTNAFNVILNQGYQDWISTKSEDKEARETLYYGQIAALKFKQVLINTIDNGRLLEEERKLEVK
jgi:hypothetical protein|tara:strand:+ start:206 stop:463 length:258 start_codon:yes stop_codon:yes gene_type:complete